MKTKTNIFYVRILSEKWETKCQTRKQKQNWAYNFCLLLFSRTHCCRMLNSFLFFLSFIFQASLVIICSPACCIIIWFVYVALVCFFFRCAKRKEKDKHKPTNNQQNTTIYLFSFCFKATWKIKFKQKRNNQSDRQHHVCMHAQSCNYDFFLFSNLCFLLCCSCIQHIKFHLVKKKNRKGGDKECEYVNKQTPSSQSQVTAHNQNENKNAQPRSEKNAANFTTMDYDL